MYKPVEEKTVDQLLLDAYKAQVSTYVKLLEVKDAQVDFLEERIRDLEMKLNRYKCDNTGLTAKEREEIAKLSKEIMDESEEENDCLEEVTLEIDFEDFKNTLRKAMTHAFGLEVGSKENTTNKNSDANGPCANPYPNRQESIVERYLSFRNSFTKLKWFELERLIESKFNEKAGKLLLDDSDIDSILQQFESSKD